MTVPVFELCERAAAPTSPTDGLLAVYATSTGQIGTVDDTGLMLTAPVIRENETLAVVPQKNSGSSATGISNVTTTELAVGLGTTAGFSITPQVTGRVMVIIAGMGRGPRTTAATTAITGRYGTGTPPAAGASTGLGTAFGAQQHFISSTTAGQQGFTCMGIITGLALNTAVWFDLSVVSDMSTAVTPFVLDIQIIVVEI